MRLPVTKLIHMGCSPEPPVGAVPGVPVPTKRGDETRRPGTGTATRSHSWHVNVAAREPRLAAELARIGYPEPRLRSRGYMTLLRTIVGQQVSVAAAASMWGKLEAELGGITDAVVATPDWIGQQQVAVEEFVRQQSMELVVQTVDGAETEAGDPVQAGTIVVQLPEPGTPLVEGSVVVITVVAPA